MVWVTNARRRDLAILSRQPSAEPVTKDIDIGIPQLAERLRAMPGAAVGRNVEVGVECVLPPGGVNGIETSATPEGLVATTEHVGPFETLPDAHAAVRAWCRSNGWQISGTSWEVAYGRWSGDPGQWRTALYYLVR